MVFTPIDIGPTGLASAINYVHGLDLVKNLADFSLMLHAYGSGVHIFALVLEEGF